MFLSGGSGLGLLRASLHPSRMHLGEREACASVARSCRSRAKCISDRYRHNYQHTPPAASAGARERGNAGTQSQAGA